MVRVRVAKCMNRTLPTRKVIWRVSSLVTLPLISTGREICVQQGHWWRHSACLFEERNSPGKEHLSSTMFYWREHLSLTSRPLKTRRETGLVHRIHMERAAEDNSFITETIGWLTNIISYIISTRYTQVLCWLPDTSLLLKHFYKCYVSVITSHHILIDRCQLVQQSVLRYCPSSAHPSVTCVTCWQWLKSPLVSCHQRAVNRKCFWVNICIAYCACLVMLAFEVQRWCFESLKAGELTSPPEL